MNDKAIRVHIFTPLRLVLGAFIVLTLIYAWATPIFEASDELWHFGVIQHIANTGELPVQVLGVETPWEQEGSQPPLYYLIAAALVSPIDRSDFDAVRQPNPHNIAGIPGAVGNKNLVLHDTTQLQGTALAVYIVRLFSIMLGCVTVYAVYQTALVFQNDQQFALLAAAITSFNPMFLFITASANNDNLVTALNSLIIWQTLVMLRNGFKTRRSIVLAGLIALTSLSKLSGLVLIPVVALVGLWVAKKTHNWRGLIVLGAFIIGLWMVVAGWWYARNLTLYGELFGTRTMAEVAGVREGEFTLTTLLSEFQGFRFSYWALFGAFNIMTFRWFYDVMDILTLVSIAGLIWGVRRAPRKEIEKIVPLALVVLLGAIGVIAWTAQTFASQGRLLFPYMAASSTLFAYGLWQIWLILPLRGFFFGNRFRQLWAMDRYVLLVIPVVFAFIVPFAMIAPEYTPPPPSSVLPSSARQVYARYGDVALIGYETPDQRYQPGDTVPMTVYWQVIERSERDYSLYLNAVNGEGDVIGKVDSYPGAGRLRTTTWQEGAIYADTYGISLDATASGQFLLRVQVGWWHYPSQEVLEPIAEDGEALPPVLLDTGGFSDGQSADIPENLTAVNRVDFGGVITLTGYRFEGDSLVLAWEALGTPAANYTVFVQVLDESNSIVGQGDAPPELPTRYWQRGERFMTRHTIVYPQALEAGTYRVVIGWYRQDNFERLGGDFPDSAYPLTTITIENR
jgi:4-amino-4-deoxy-L-arabinose transferase-like glycosyltransferase